MQTNKTQLIVRILKTLTNELFLLILAAHVEFLLVLEEDHEVAVVPEDGVRDEARDELLVHRDRLLEGRQVLRLQLLHVAKIMSTKIYRICFLGVRKMRVRVRQDQGVQDQGRDNPS